MPVLPLPAVPPGVEILLDANVIVYAIGNRSAQCGDLLRRCGAGEINGFTTVDALIDVCHRLMLAEAAGRALIARPNASSLKGKHQVIRQLLSYWQHVEQTRRVLAVLPFDEHRFVRAHAVRTSDGMMANDSILLAAADVFGIPAVATNDADFDPVPWITDYKTTDLP